MKHPITRVLFIAMGFLWGCGSAGTGVSNPPTQTAAAAAATLFSTEENQASFQALRLAPFSVQCENDPGCTCTVVINELGSQDLPLEHAAFAGPGTYGAATHPIEVEEDDFCTLPSGEENQSLGPDGKGRLAYFQLTDDIENSCTTSGGVLFEATMKAGSEGLWRNTVSESGEIEHSPEIYASMIFQVGGVQTTLDCTVFLGSGGMVSFADCTDPTGASVAVDLDATCVPDH